MLKGLTQAQVDESRLKYGENLLIDTNPKMFFCVLKKELRHPLMKLLIVIEAIFVIMILINQKHELVYPVIGSVIGILAVLFSQTKKELTRESKRLNTENKELFCKVYREGHLVEISIAEIVVGDFVLLERGNQVPADGVLVDGSLKVDNSALNKDSSFYQKQSHPIGEVLSFEDWPLEITNHTLSDESSMFRGSKVVEGSGVMKVMRVGMNTVIGEILMKLMSETN